jgi:phosphate transport system substrate-binding protein
MAMRNGRCTNFGLCAKADTKEVQSVPDGADFVCKECTRPLTAVGGASSGGGSGQSMQVIVVAVGALLLLGTAGYLGWHFIRGSSSSGSGTSTGATSAPATSPPSSSTGSNATTGPAPLLRLSGSNTIGAELAVALADAWLAQRGATGVHRDASAPDETIVSGTQSGAPVAVQVKAHGSATAFTDLAAGAADIGMASRSIQPEEAANLRAKGFGDLTSNANEKVLGLDGVAVIVHEANPVDAMTKDEVAAIFTGASSGRHWNIYARDDKSGTYDTFKDRVLGGKPLVAGAKRFEDSRALVSAVAQDHDGIGFVGLPYAAGAKIIAISEKNAASLVPNTATVRTESYPLSRRLYLYVPDMAKPEARDFVRFALSPQGQDIVQKTGFVGQKIEVAPREKAPAHAPSGYAQLMPASDRLETNFYFRTGSSELDTKAVDDIKRVAAEMASQFNGRGLMLIGFADNTGNPARNVVLSKDRAEAVAAQMKRQGITPVLVTGFGQELPIRDNTTAEGREKNRRVEIWLRK